MTQRQRPESFADMVSAVEHSPQPPREPSGPSLDGPDGRRFTPIARGITVDRSIELVRDGASVAWDECGCGSLKCALTWLPDEDALELVRAERPRVGTKKSPGELSEWRTEDGTTAVLAEGKVRWGTLMA